MGGRDIAGLSGDALADYRAATVGFVFQFYNLIPTLTVHENVALVKEIAPDALSATKMLEKVGPSDHLRSYPAELSGGEQQRVSLALAGEYEMRMVIAPATYVISLVLTVGMSLLVSWMVSRKNRKIDMVEALKGAE